MAAPQPGVTLTFSIPVLVPTQLSVGLTNRRYFLVVNNPFLADGLTKNMNYIAIAMGTNNLATVNHIPIPPGGNYEIGPLWTGNPQEPNLFPPQDISVIALTATSGNPQVSFLEF